MSKLLKLCVLISTLALLDVVSAASQESAEMQVSLTIVESCRFNVDSLDFGSQDIETKSVTEQTNLYVTCTNGTPYSIMRTSHKLELAPQANSGAVLGYNLYSDPALSQEFGSDTAHGIANTGTGEEQKIPLYGRVDYLSRAIAGKYSDTVTLTVFY